MVCGAVLFSAAFASPGQHALPHNITLRGQVQTKDGQVIPVGVTVTLETQQGLPMVSRTVDSSGNFEFPALVGGNYNLSVKTDGFQPYQQSLDLSDAWISLYNVKIVLLPLDKSKVNLSALPSLTDQAAPKDARKEFEKGARAWRENKLTEARNHLEKAVEEYPCFARAQAALAEVDLADHKLDSAEARYKQAIHCDGTYLDAFYSLARLYMTENKPQDSETILREGLRLSPNAWLFHYQLGTVHFARGEYQKASQDFLTAQSLHPDMPAEFHAKLANTYLKTGEYRKALAEVDTYLRLSPEGPYATSAKKISEVLRSGGVTSAEPEARASSTSKPGPE
jgi:tetratricopeptide (TPR) repeat protein